MIIETHCNVIGFW